MFRKHDHRICLRIRFTVYVFFTVLIMTLINNLEKGYNKKLTTRAWNSLKNKLYNKILIYIYICYYNLKN